MFGQFSQAKPLGGGGGFGGGGGGGGLFGGGAVGTGGGNSFGGGSKGFGGGGFSSGGGGGFGGGATGTSFGGGGGQFGGAGGGGAFGGGAGGGGFGAGNGGGGAFGGAMGGGGGGFGGGSSFGGGGTGGFGGGSGAFGGGGNLSSSTLPGNGAKGMFGGTSSFGSNASMGMNGGIGFGGGGNSAGAFSGGGSLNSSFGKTGAFGGAGTSFGGGGGNMFSNSGGTSLGGGGGGGSGASPFGNSGGAFGGGGMGFSGGSGGAGMFGGGGGGGFGGNTMSSFGGGGGGGGGGASTGSFGSNFGGSNFVGSSVSGNGKGTINAKFQPPPDPNDTDRKGSKLFSITALRDFENRSYEELRLEDYELKSAMGNGGGGGVGFGSTAPSGFSSSFNQGKVPFGNSSSGFGQSQPTTSTFGSFGSSTSQFGANTSTFTSPSKFGGTGGFGGGGNMFSSNSMASSTSQSNTSFGSAGGFSSFGGASQSKGTAFGSSLSKSPTTTGFSGGFGGGMGLGGGMGSTGLGASGGGLGGGGGAFGGTSLGGTSLGGGGAFGSGGFGGSSFGSGGLGAGSLTTSGLSPGGQKTLSTFSSPGNSFGATLGGMNPQQSVPYSSNPYGALPSIAVKSPSLSQPPPPASKPAVPTVLATKYKITPRPVPLKPRRTLTSPYSTPSPYSSISPSESPYRASSHEKSVLPSEKPFRDILSFEAPSSDFKVLDLSNSEDDEDDELDYSDTFEGTLHDDRDGLLQRDTENGRDLVNVNQTPGANAVLPQKTSKAFTPIFHDDLSYLTKPPRAEIEAMKEDQLKNISAFTIERRDSDGQFLGSITWRNVDITFVNFKGDVEIDSGAVDVYKDDATKPSLGQKLNREAEISLRIFPKKDTVSPSKFEASLKKLNDSIPDSTFVSWDSKTGLWNFRVKHFTRYGADNLDDDDDDDDGASGEDNNVEVIRDTKLLNSTFASRPPPTLPSQSAISDSTHRSVASSSELTLTKSLRSQPFYSSDFPHAPLDRHALREALFSADSDSEEMEDTRKPNLFQMLANQTHNDNSDDSSTDHMESTEMFFDNESRRPISFSIEPDHHDGLLPHASQKLRKFVQQEPLGFPILPIDHFLKSVSLLDNGKNLPRIFRSTANLFDAGCSLRQSFRPCWSHLGSVFSTHSSVFVSSCSLRSAPNFEANEILSEAIRLEKFMRLRFEMKRQASFSIDDYLRVMADIIKNEEKPIVGEAESPEIMHIWQIALSMIQVLWGSGVKSNNSSFSEVFCSDLDRSDEFFRRNQLTIWIRQTQRSELDPLWHALSECRIEDACDLLSRQGNFRLAIMLTQFFHEDTKDFLRSQIEEWLNVGESEKVLIQNNSVYELLSGNVEGVLETLPSLDWPRCLGVYLWFCSSHSLAHILEQFLSSKSSGDTCFELLKLYFLMGEKSSEDVIRHQLIRSIDPVGYSSDLLDYSLSWFLYSILRDFGLPQLSDVSHNSLLLSFSAQLEWLGLWPWGIFVLQNLPNNSSFVRDILYRNYPSRSQRIHPKEGFSALSSDFSEDIREISLLPCCLQITFLQNWLDEYGISPLHGNQLLINSVMGLLDGALASLDKLLSSLGVEDTLIKEAQSYRSAFDSALTKAQ